MMKGWPAGWWLWLYVEIVLLSWRLCEITSYVFCLVFFFLFVFLLANPMCLFLCFFVFLSLPSSSMLMGGGGAKKSVGVCATCLAIVPHHLWHWLVPHCPSSSPYVLKTPLHVPSWPPPLCQSIFPSTSASFRSQAWSSRQTKLTH